MALNAECPACHQTIKRMVVTHVGSTFKYQCPLCPAYFFVDPDGSLGENAIRDQLRQDLEAGKGRDTSD